MDFLACSTGLCGHAPDATRAVDVSAVGDVQDEAPVARPERAELVIVTAVVVARQIAQVFVRQLHGIFELPLPEVRHEQMKAPVILARGEDDARTIRREARLDIDGTIAGERMHRAAAKIERLEFDCFTGVGTVDDPAAIR